MIDPTCEIFRRPLWSPRWGRASGQEVTFMSRYYGDIGGMMDAKKTFCPSIEADYLFEPGEATPKPSLARAMFDTVLTEGSKTHVMTCGGVDVFMYEPRQLGPTLDVSPMNLLWGYYERIPNGSDDLVFGAYHEGRELLCNTVVETNGELGGLLVTVLRGSQLPYSWGPFEHC